MKIPITDYIAFNAFDEANRLAVSKYGMAMAGDTKELRRNLSAIFKTYPEEAMRDFAMIHPDMQMLKEFSGKPEKQSNCCGSMFSGGENESNCSGCGGTCGGKKKRYAFDGEGNSQAPEMSHNNTHHNTGGLIMFALTATILFLSIKEIA